MKGTASVRIAVVGAGLSGLVAAYRLVQAGADVVVLEARKRVGGRAWRMDVGGLPFDAGAEAIDDAHRTVLALADELEVATWRTGPWAAVQGECSPLVAALEERIAELAARIDPAHPEDTRDASILDMQTLHGWLAERDASADVLAEAETHYSVASSSVPIGEMSLLAYATKVAAGAAPTGLTVRMRGGPSVLAERLAAHCEVQTGTVVTGIQQGDAGVRIQLADGATVSAARAILAIPLPLQRRLRFDPPLPEHRRLALERARYGEVVKAALPYDRRLTGPLPELSAAGFVYQPDPGVPLLALFAAAGAARRARTIESLAAVDWSREAFSRGSYLIFGPGDLTTWGRRLIEAQRRLHFAGSEASSLPSYMEGAVRAGERAADEVLSAG
jgi:monoamine oxidase